MFRSILSLCSMLIFLPVITGCTPDSQNNMLFYDNFEQGQLDMSRWEITSEGDFAEATVDVVDIDPSEDTDYRLRLRAKTIGTSDPLKYLGVRSLEKIDLTSSLVIKFDLDWNNQPNGCYLTASVYLCPIISNNPKGEDNWLKFEYAGVPPGRNVSTRVQQRVDGLNQILYEDRGPYDSQGKPLGQTLGSNKHIIELILNKDRVFVFQDGVEIYSSSIVNVNFTTAFIYLQMSSGTNYPSREVYFDNIIVRATP